MLAGDSQLTDNSVMDCIGHTHCNMFSLVTNDTLILTVIGLTGIIDQLKTLKYFSVSTFLFFTSFPALHQIFREILCEGGFATSSEHSLKVLIVVSNG